MSTKNAILLFLIIIFAQLRESEGLTTTVKSHLQPNYTKWLDYESGGEDFVYAMCSHTYYKPIDTHCIVSLESTSFRTIWTCNVTLWYTREIGNMFLPVRVLQFGHNKALLIWSTDNNYSNGSEKLKMNFVTVHFTSCRTSEVFTLPMELSSMEALTLPVWTYQDDTFDIVYPKAEGCGDERTCKVTVNAEGKQVDDPVPWFPFYPYRAYDGDLGSFPLIPQMRSKGYLLLDKRFKYTEAILVTEDGHNQKMFGSYTSYHSPILSTAHHTIGICHNWDKAEHKYNCEQYTLSGRLKLKAYVNLPWFEERYHSTRLYNLHNGGFLLLRGEYSRNRWVDLTKVDGNGQVIGTLEIKGSQCAPLHLTVTKFFVNELRKQCLTLACQDSDVYEISNHPDSLDFVTTCFTDDDFQLN